MTATKIIGFGNSLHGDDGFAEVVLQRLLDTRELPSSVQLHNAGIAGLNALPLFENTHSMLVIDVIDHKTAKAPLAWYSVEEVIALDNNQSDHGIGLGYLFCALKCMMSPLPSIRCLLCAVAPLSSFTLSLSTNVQSLVPSAVEEVYASLPN